MRRNERGGHHYWNEAPFLLAPFLSVVLLASICSDQKNVSPAVSNRPVPQPTPDILAFREDADCREVLTEIQGAHNKSGLTPYGGKYYLIASPLDGSALRVLVLTSKEDFKREVESFDANLRDNLSRTNIEYFPVTYYRVGKKIEGGGTLVDESVPSIPKGERGIGPACYSPAPATPAAAPASR
ncbi:MAG: hypothetical protein HYT08_02500 [Candidatus Levybacteria bacterium]|nr:hypothetical protein [Candidatus Levybacteria bacterium]